MVSNLGLSLAAGVLSVVDAAGTALSATNFGYVCVPSTTAGRHVLLKVLAPASFNDDSHASSSLTNFGFGITEAAHWANDMPFFLYVVNKGDLNLDGVDGSSMFFLARNPAMATTPAAANNIGDTGTIAVTDDKTSILILADVTVADYVSLPCQLVGALRMRWSTTTDDWTVQALGTSDGIGKDQLDKTFATIWTMPQGQNGAGATSHLLLNGGTTIPVFTTNTYKYMLFRDGRITFSVELSGDGGADGNGAVAAIVALPVSATADFPGVEFLEYIATPLVAAEVGFGSIYASDTTFNIVLVSTCAAITLSTWNAGVRALYTNGTYKGF
jgi:hypothetical protein